MWPEDFCGACFQSGSPRKGKHEGQRLALGEKIRLFAHRAEQIQRHHGAGGDQARQQPLRLLDGRWPGRGLRAPHAGFDKRRRRSRQLRVPGQIEAQGMPSSQLCASSRVRMGL